jgi:hypothetical protein
MRRNSKTRTANRRVSALAWISVLATLALTFGRCAGTDRAFLRGLPFGGYISGTVSGYSDCEGKANIAVFGALRDGYADTDYLSIADRAIAAYGLGDELNLLFFDVEQSYDDVREYAASQIWNGVSVFVGGAEQMWDALDSEGVGTALTPVALYVSADGEIVSHSIGERSKSEIISDIFALLKRGDGGAYANIGAAGARVLADSGGAYHERRDAIIDYWERLQAAAPPRNADCYDSPPRIDAPYSAGTLKREYIDYGLTALNFSRFLAGLPDDVTDTAELNDLAGHGALLMAVSEYGHEPPRPPDMEDAVYEKGLRGARAGNIAFSGAADADSLWGIADNVLRGWMADYGADNISDLGHRRMFLNPDMLYTGFGQADAVSTGGVTRYSVAGASDNSRGELVEYQAVAYPGGAAFPSELFPGYYPWSITLNPDVFAPPDIETVSVILRGGGETYIFSKDSASNSASSGGDYFNVNTDAYGAPNCVIFRPANIDIYANEYTVSVTGLKTADGADARLSYTVNFFSLREGRN